MDIDNNILQQALSTPGGTQGQDHRNLALLGDALLKIFTVLYINSKGVYHTGLTTQLCNGVLSNKNLSKCLEPLLSKYELKLICKEDEHIDDHTKAGIVEALYYASSQTPGNQIFNDINKFIINSFTAALFKKAISVDIKPNNPAHLFEKILGTYYNVHSSVLYTTKQHAIQTQESRDGFIATISYDAIVVSKTTPIKSTALFSAYNSWISKWLIQVEQKFNTKSLSDP